MTVKELITKLEELAAKAGSSHAPVLFVLRNRPHIRLALAAAGAIEPLSSTGYGGADGVSLRLHASAGLPSHAEPIEVGSIIRRLTSLNLQIGCDGERTAGHGTKSTVEIHVINGNADMAVKLDGVEINHAATLAEANGIVFDLTAR